MSDAIVFISHNKVKPGRFDALKAYAPRVAEAIDRDKPGTVVFLMYADPEGSRASIVHVFPDGDAMQRHLEGVDARASEAFRVHRDHGLRDLRLSQRADTRDDA
jgi:quinol monooxygenase YgiN